MSIRKGTERELRDRRPDKYQLIPSPILLVWELLFHKGIMISSASGKDVFVIHRTSKGERGDGRKLGEARESWSGMQKIWVVDRIVTGSSEVLKLFRGWTVSQRWGL